MGFSCFKKGGDRLRHEHQKLAKDGSLSTWEREREREREVLYFIISFLLFSFFFLHYTLVGLIWGVDPCVVSSHKSCIWNGDGVQIVTCF